MSRARDRADGDFAGKELILDADADTSITVDTDDQIDIRINGSDQIKLASDEVVFNEQSIDVDFRVESDNDANAFFVQGSDGKIGMGISTPRNNLDFGVTSNNDHVIALRDNNTSRTILGLTNGYGVRVGSPADGTNSENMFEVGEINASDGTTYQNTHFAVTYGGNATINNGNLIIGTSGKGIDFSATSDGSGANQAEVLDDYEEGTWTPTLTNGGSVTINAAVYTKIGNIVRVGTYLALSSIPNNSNAFYIAGFPYNVSYTAGGGNDHYHGAGSITYVGSHNIAGFGMLPPTPYTGQANMYFHRGDGSSSVVTNANVTGMAYIIVATSYMTA